MAKRNETIPVSELKSKLLEIVRRVEAGQGFRITKGGHVVAALVPISEAQEPTIGFAPVTIIGSLSDPVIDSNSWTFDQDNIK